MSLRPTRHADNSTVPLIYVDGAPTIGTCVLVQIPTFNIERIEVYSTGGGGGYRRNQNGVILIGTKRG